MRKSVFCFGLMASATLAQVNKPIKWACVGNSITAGYPDVSLAYAPRLANLLGPQYSLQNDGVSGTTLLKKGDMPYWTKGLLGNVFAFKPDIITIKLGTNDTKSQNWQYQADFVKDLTALVDTLSGISSHPQIWLCLPCPIYSNTYGIIDSIVTKYIIPDIQQVATAKGLNVIDVNTPLRNHSNLFSDGVHPTAAGSDSIAAIFYRTFLSKVTRVACVGNSITQYVGTVSGAAGIDSYTSQLNMLLGKGYYAQNDGVSGAFMQKQTSMPYWTQGKLPAVFALKPSIITLALGTNDARPTNWNRARFLTDARAMIDTLTNSWTPKPKLWVCLPMPSWKLNGQWQYDNGIAGNGISNDLIRDSVIPALKQVAAEKGVPTIDLNTPMQPWQAYVTDGVHPNAQGQDTLAQNIYRALTAPVSVAPGGAKNPSDTRALPGTPPKHEAYSVDGRTVKDPLPASSTPRREPAPSQNITYPH